MQELKHGVVCALEEKLPEHYPVVLKETVKTFANTVAGIGYDAVELHIMRPKQYDAPLLREEAHRAGIAFCAIATGMEYRFEKLSLISSDRTVRNAAVKRLFEHIDLAEAISCPVIVGMMRGNLSAPGEEAAALRLLSDAFTELSDYAGEKGVTLLLEPICRELCNYLNSTVRALDFLSALGKPNIRMHLDSYSMLREGEDMEKSVLLCRELLSYLHLCDSGRTCPGDGTLDFLPLLHGLKTISYKGYLSFECDASPEPYAAARRSLGYIKEVEKRLFNA